MADQEILVGLEFTETEYSYKVSKTTDRMVWYRREGNRSEWRISKSTFISRLNRSIFILK